MIGCWIRQGCHRTDVVRPFELDGEGLVAGLVAVDAFGDGESGEVLEEDYGSFGGEGDVVADHDGEHEGPSWGDPDVGSAAAAGYLDGGGGGEAAWETAEELGISVQG